MQKVLQNFAKEKQEIQKELNELKVNIVDSLLLYICIFSLNFTCEGCEFKK